MARRRYRTGPDDYPVCAAEELAVEGTPAQRRALESYAVACASLKSGVKHAWECGRHLAEAKAETPHGQWLPWLRRHDIPKRRAQRWMRLAELDIRQIDAFGTIEEALKSLKPDTAEAAAVDTRYAPPEVVEAARTVMGGIDLDPVSAPEAQQWIKAAQWFTDDDALDQSWKGSVWLQPPAGSADLYAAKLLAEIADGNVSEAVAMIPAALEAVWAQRLMAASSAVFVPLGRIRDVNSHGVDHPAKGSKPSVIVGVNIDPDLLSATLDAALVPGMTLTPVATDDDNDPFP